MAVRLEVKQTISTGELAKALLDKNTQSYANREKWGPYSYKDQIFPQARVAFGKFYKSEDYPTDEAFLQKFLTDFSRHDPQLLKAIYGDKLETLSLLGEESATMANQQPAVSAVSASTAQSAIVPGGGGGNVPSYTTSSSSSFSTSPIIRNLEKTEELPGLETEKQQAVKSAEQIIKGAAKQEPSPVNPLPTKSSRNRFQLPKFPSGIRGKLTGVGSNIGIFVKRNFGTISAGGIGGVVGLGLTGGNPLGGLGGGLIGGLGSLWIKNGGGTTLGNIGGGVIDRSVKVSQHVSGPRSKFSLAKKSSAKVAWILLGLLLLFMGIGVVGNLFSNPETEQPTAESDSSSSISTDLTVSLNGPGGCTDDCKVDNNQEITYEANIVYKGSGSADIEVSGRIPSGAHLTKAGVENWTIISANTFGQVITNLAASEARKVYLTFKGNEGRTDFWTTHQILAKVLKTNKPVSASCQAKYASIIKKNPDNINFGDPDCDFSKDDLYAMLKQQDPKNADFWYLKVIPCESPGYNPNAYFRCNSNGRCTPDPAGAWGLFQMGRGKNGIYDHGDVAWQNQISNAVNYNKTKLAPQGLSIGAYWECAR